MPVFYTPRFSYACPETTISACRQRVVYRGGVRVRRCPWEGGVPGYGTGWVGGRAIPGTTSPPTLQGPDSEAGPVSPCKGLEWVVRTVPGWAAPRYHPAGPVGPPVALPVPGTLETPPLGQ